MVIYAKCSNCGEPYEVEDDCLGMEFECPECDATIVIGKDESEPKLSIQKAPDLQSSSNDKQKTCPNCHHPIANSDAVICIECGTNLTSGNKILSNSNSVEQESSWARFWDENNERWWDKVFIVSPGFALFAWFTYYDLTKFESGQKSFFSSWEPVVWMYKFGGKWAATSVFILCSICALIWGMLMLIREIKNVKPDDEIKNKMPAVPPAPPVISNLDAGIFLGREQYVKQPEKWIKISMTIIVLSLSLPTVAIIFLLLAATKDPGFLIPSLLWFMVYLVFVAYTVHVWRYKFACCAKGVYLQGLFSRKELLYEEIERALFEYDDRKTDHGGFTIVRILFEPVQLCTKSKIKFRWIVGLGGEEMEGFGYYCEYIAEHVENVEEWRI